MPDQNQSIREALQRDAAGMSKPDFDSTLHYTAMRCIRTPAEKADHPFRLVPASAIAAAVMTLAAAFALWHMRSHPELTLAVPSTSAPAQQHSISSSPFISSAGMPRTSLLTYQAAAGRGDDALFALLDRDARELLPSSSPVFNTPLH